MADTSNKAPEVKIVPVDIGDASHTADIPEKKWSCSSIFRSCIVEVFTFFMIVFVVVRPVTTIDLLKEKVCRWNLELSEDACSNITSLNKSTQVQIVTLANDYNMFVTLVGTTPAALIAIFIAPWTHKYGRRIPIFMAVLGEVLRSAGFWLISQIPEADANAALIISIPGGIFGGWASVLSCVFSQATASITAKERSTKLFFIEVALGVGAAVGTLLGGQLYSLYGYMGVYGGATGLGLVALVTGVAAMDKSVNQDDWTVKVKAFFSVDSIRHNFKVARKKRSNNGRSLLWLFLLSIGLHRMSELAVVPVGYPYAREVFEWENTTYSNYYTILLLSGFALMIPTTIFLTRCLHLSDYALAIVGTLSAAVKCSMMGIEIVIIYCAAFAVGVCSKAGIAGIRALNSKIVENDEIGSLYALQAAVESLAPIVSAVLFTSVFNASLDLYPGLAFQVAAAMLVVPFLVCIWAYRFRPQPQKAAELEEATTRL